MSELRLLEYRQGSSLATAVADVLNGADAVSVSSWTSEDGRTVLLLRGNGRDVVIAPDPDGKRLAFGGQVTN